MEALDHCRINRNDLSLLLVNNGIKAKYIIPEDGETIDLSTLK